MAQYDRVTRSEGRMSMDLNGPVNQILVTLEVYKPILVHRIGVISNAAQGLLEPMQLKLRKSTAANASLVDIPNTLFGGLVLPRGEGIDKEVNAKFLPGDSVFIAIDVPAGAASTGDPFIEFWDLPFSGEDVANFTKSPLP